MKISIRPMNKLHLVHIVYMSIYLIPCVIALIGEIANISIIINSLRYIHYFVLTVFFTWLIFDFFKPGLPVSMKYLFFHHVIGFSIALTLFLNEQYTLLSIGLLLQEAYTLMFRRIFYVPRFELSVDIMRFFLGGMLFYYYAISGPWYTASIILIFGINNLFFFGKTHRKLFVQSDYSPAAT